jgi:hypothetical protein
LFIIIVVVVIVVTDFELVHEVPTKAFLFGGQTGNNITQLVFIKK